VAGEHECQFPVLALDAPCVQDVVLGHVLLRAVCGGHEDVEFVGAYVKGHAVHVQWHVLLGTDAFFDDAGNKNTVLFGQQLVLADIQDVQAGVSGKAVQNSESAKAVD